VATALGGLDVVVAGDGPRIAPGTRAEVGRITWGLARISGRVTGTGPPNHFLTLGRHRKLIRSWLRFAGRLMPGGTLLRREIELVILRVAHLRARTYEFDLLVQGDLAGVGALRVPLVEVAARLLRE
jgi:hypothetical protein